MHDKQLEQVQWRTMSMVRSSCTYPVQRRLKEQDLICLEKDIFQEILQHPHSADTEVLKGMGQGSLWECTL